MHAKEALIGEHNLHEAIQAIAIHTRSNNWYNLLGNKPVALGCAWLSIHMQCI